MGDIFNLRPPPARRQTFGAGRGLWLALVAGVVSLGAAAAWDTETAWKPNVIRASRSGSQAATGALIGRASVIDGDTIQIQSERIRLNGIDAPESRQSCARADGARYACGRAAANALDDFLAASRPTRCEFIERDRYGRFVGKCYRADGAAWLVRNGFALDWARYSGGRYASDQQAARIRKAGVWQGTFDMPWDWRKSRK